MSNKSLLIAGVLLAAGSVAAVSSPYFRGAQQRLSQMLDEFGDGDSGSRSGRSGKRHRQMDADDENEGGKEQFTKSRRERFAKRDFDDETPDVGSGSRERFGGRQGRRSQGEADQREPEETGGRAARRAGRLALERTSGHDDMQFSRLDRNGDGFIDAKELEIWVAERSQRAAQRLLKRFDADGDGRVSKDEFRQFAKERLTNRNVDGGDSVIEAELAPPKSGRGSVD
jgi:Ca2+-binding EF-hand superfamily protein